MLNQNNEMKLEEIIELLQNEKKNYDSCTLKNKLKLENLLNELTITALSLIGSDLEDVILLGNEVEVKLEYEDGDIDYAEFNLCMDFHDDCVSVLSPLGSSIFGAKVGETVSYEVEIENNLVGNPIKINATILSKNKNLTSDVEEKEQRKIYTNN